MQANMHCCHSMIFAWLILYYYGIPQITVSPLWPLNILMTIEWIAITFATDIHVPPKMNCNNASDPLTHTHAEFSSPLTDLTYCLSHLHTHTHTAHQLQRQTG